MYISKMIIDLYSSIQRNYPHNAASCMSYEC